MTKREFLKCINYIDDELIIQVNVDKGIDYNNRNSIFKIISLVAACIVVIVTISMVTKVSLTKNSMKEYATTMSNDSLIPDLYTFVFDGYIYEVLYDEKLIKRQGLPEKVDESMVGKLLQKSVIRNGHNKILGDVYEYKEVSNRNIVIIKDTMGKYHYALRCNKHDDTIY